jgi:hypothetical protein
MDLLVTETVRERGIPVHYVEAIKRAILHPLPALRHLGIPARFWGRPELEKSGWPTATIMTIRDLSLLTSSERRIT